MKKHKILSIFLFTIIITCLALYFQWAEFYEGYSISSDNLAFSVLFLLTWVIFSFYWGFIKEKKYKKFIAIYWGINIIMGILFFLFNNNTLIKSILNPFYIWYGGPLYGFLNPFAYTPKTNMDIPNLILLTSPLGMLFNFIGYFAGSLLSKLKIHQRTNSSN